jgi:hypothetical protein
MPARKVSLQIEVSETVRNRLKSVAYDKGQTLNEYVMRALSKTDDPELKQLITVELKKRPKPGRPTK